MVHRRRSGLVAVGATALAALAAVSGSAAVAGQRGARGAARVKHVVVIFQENTSFDHYFASYPRAKNPPGEPAFHAAPGTPSIDGVNGPLATSNPNGVNPQRLDRHDWPLCDMSHEYDPELRAWDGGKNDRFVQESVDYERSDVPGPGYGQLSAGVTGGVTKNDCTTPVKGHESDQATNKEVMDYYDGNTVTAVWNYAQHGVLFDQSFSTTFGPSTPGAINLISGQTSGITVPAGSDDLHTCADINWLVTLGLDCFVPKGTPAPFIGDGDIRNGTVIGDPDPAYDDCASTNRVGMTGRNVGDILNEHHVTWGWFEGGFRPSTPATATTPAACKTSHHIVEPDGTAGPEKKDYNPHHEPFMYYASTANPHHLPPTSVRMIGKTDRANHQYDMLDFYRGLKAGVLPAVSFLKAPNYQDGHAGYSDPLDEQRFIVTAVNAIERSRFWDSTAIIIAWDDSDGFYDHVAPPIVNHDTEVVPGPVVGGVQWPGNGCGPAPDAASSTGPLGPATGRCGYGPRLPFLILSPWGRPNTVDSAVTDQTSILRFVEDRFAGGERVGGGSFDAIAGSLAGAFDFRHRRGGRLILDPGTGLPVKH